MSVCAVAGVRPFASRPQASIGCMTAVAVKISAALDACTKLRRDKPPAGFDSGMFLSHLGAAKLSIATVFLQHLDFIAIGVFDEKELREQCSLAVEFFHWFRGEAQRL